MAYKHLPSKPRHVSHRRRAHKRQLREEALHRELELREHSPAAAPERSPRRKKPSRIPFWKLARRAVMVLAVFGVAELVLASLTAKPFQVKNLEISGCEITDSNAVKDISQALVGQNFIRANTKQVAREIEAIPTVRDVSISRSLDWPPRMHVIVQERQAFAKVGAGDNWWVADKEGTVFRPAGDEDKNLYAVTSPKLLPEAGKKLPDEQWHSVAEIASALQTEPGQSWTLRRIYFDKDGSAALRLSGGFHDETLVRLGGDHWEQKLVRARQTLDYFERTGKRAAVLNLVSYEMPQWTPRHAAVKQEADPEEPVADTSSET